MKYCRENLTATYSESDFVFFWSHKPAKGGELTEACFSQWWKCSFVEDGITFCCAEQYMMYKKCYPDYGTPIYAIIEVQGWLVAKSKRNFFSKLKGVLL